MDRVIEIRVSASQSGRRIKDILRSDLRVSAAILTQLKKEKDGILLGGNPVFATEKVKVGERLRITIRDGNSGMEKAELPLSVLYEDEDVILLDKPRNMPTHPSQNHHEDTLANGLMGYFSGQNFIFRAITRLDKDTSGVVLVAKNPLSGAILVEDMKLGRIQKEYMAVTNGTPKPLSGHLEAPIKRQEESIVLRCVSPDGRESVTEYETVGEMKGLALVRLRPLTGRTHQLRVHMSYLGCPIFGDDLYGAPQRGEATRLHCGKLQFFHPITGRELVVEAPLPSDMTDLVK